MYGRQAIIDDLNRAHVAAKRAKDLVQAGITGFLDGAGRTSIQQDGADHPQRVLRAKGQQDLVRMGQTSAPWQHVTSDGIPWASFPRRTGA